MKKVRDYGMEQRMMESNSVLLAEYPTSHSIMLTI
jgi:hypothetical protein